MRGFTLLEVLVAFTVLALTLPLAFRAISGAMGMSARLDGQVQAALLAEARLGMAGVESALEPGVTAGDGGNGFRWITEIRPHRDDQAGAAVRAYDVSVTVSWGGGAHEHSVTLTTLKLQPEYRQ